MTLRPDAPGASHDPWPRGHDCNGNWFNRCGPVLSKGPSLCLIITEGEQQEEGERRGGSGRCFPVADADVSPSASKHTYSKYIIITFSVYLSYFCVKEYSIMAEWLACGAVNREVGGSNSRQGRYFVRDFSFTCTLRPTQLWRVHWFTPCQWRCQF